jgi:hypothetical protein
MDEKFVNNAKKYLMEQFGFGLKSSEITPEQLAVVEQLSTNWKKEIKHEICFVLLYAILYGTL